MNQATLVGRLGGDPETRTTAGGMVVCTLSLATDDRKKDGDKWVKATEWHRVVCFGRTAENVARYRKKGQEICVVGKIKTRKWTDKDGNDKYTTEIVADNIEFVGGGGDGRASSGAYDKPDEDPTQGEGGDNFDSEIPF